VRYAIGAAALLVVTRLRHQPLPRPTGRDLALLLALGATGLAGFNIMLIGTGSAGLRETLGATLVGAGIVLGLLRRHPADSPSPPPHPKRQGAARPD
jgi:hypothetical protein